MDLVAILWSPISNPVPSSREGIQAGPAGQAGLRGQLGRGISSPRLHRTLRSFLPGHMAATEVLQVLPGPGLAVPPCRQEALPTCSPDGPTMPQPCLAQEVLLKGWQSVGRFPDEWGRAQGPRETLGFGSLIHSTDRWGEDGEADGQDAPRGQRAAALGTEAVWCGFGRLALRQDGEWVGEAVAAVPEKQPHASQILETQDRREAKGSGADARLSQPGALCEFSVGLWGRSR